MLFCVLPFGVHQDEEFVEGCDTGAPKTKNLKKKFLITSITAFIAVLLWSVINSKYQLV